MSVPATKPAKRWAKGAWRTTCPLASPQARHTQEGMTTLTERPNTNLHRGEAFRKALSARMQKIKVSNVTETKKRGQGKLTSWSCAPNRERRKTVFEGTCAREGITQRVGWCVWRMGREQENSTANGMHHVPHTVHAPGARR